LTDLDGSMETHLMQPADLDVPALAQIRDIRFSPDLLADKVILITGAGAGIGRTLARTAAAHGATAILLGRTVAKLEAVYDEIVDAGGPTPGIAPVDLQHATMADYATLADALLAEHGRLDGLVHNAAILGDRVPLTHYPDATFRNVMTVNVDAVVRLTQVTLPLLAVAAQSNVIFTSSGVGRTPRAYWGAYAVSKYALEGYATLLADEITGTGNTRVHILNPGATGTSMRAEAYPAEDPATLQTTSDLMPRYLWALGGRRRDGPA